MSRFLLVVSALLSALSLAGETDRVPFLPVNTQGDNLIHITTADLRDTGAKDHIIVMSTEGKVIAYPPLNEIKDPAKDARLWEFSDGPSMGVTLEAGDALPGSPGEEILLPGTDGRLRILSAKGELLANWRVSPGALYSVAVAKDSDGARRILTGGVDGKVTVLNTSGETLATLMPAKKPTLIARIVTGNFDGKGGDEAAVFFAVSRLNNQIEFYDLDKLDGSRPAYWKTGRTVIDSATKIGWTNRQLPFAYDMDGDGDDEIVAHWGILHPELDLVGKTLADRVHQGELLALADYNKGKHKLTKTGKYLCQFGVPGRFTDPNTAEIATVYGDDLYRVVYDAGTQKLSIADYGYAHSAYHFTGAARLESAVGALDKLVLAGPITGDDHFYVVDLSDPNWKQAAQSINTGGQLGAIASRYAAMGKAIDRFKGTVTSAPDEPVYFRTAMGGWLTPKGDLTHEQIDRYCDRVAANIQKWMDIIGGESGYQTQRVKIVCTGGLREINETNPIEDQLAICRGFAQRGIHFNVHWDRWMCREPEKYPPSMLADIFEASVHEGICYLHLMAGEFNVEWFETENFQPYFDALQARAELLGIEPPNYLFSVKGPQWHKMSPKAWSSVFPKYGNLIVPSVENSNQREPALSFSERVGMWLNGTVDHWASKTIGDNLTPSRVMEWGGMRNAHIVFRHMLSQYALGARYFSIVSVTSAENPLYERGDTDDPNEQWTQTYRDGVFAFLKLVERGIYPAAPEPEHLLGLAPVTLAVDKPNYLRLARANAFGDYKPSQGGVALDRLMQWDAYRDVPATDLTSFLFNSKRRWDKLFPTSPAGFVPTLPYTTREQAEAFDWCDRAFQTDLDNWTEFDDLTHAREAISDELKTRASTQLFQIQGNCFWQLTRDRVDPNRAFLLLMDPNTLSPKAQTVELRMAAATGSWVLYDQLSASKEPLATLSIKEQRTSLMIDIPAGGVRLIVLKRF